MMRPIALAISTLILTAALAALAVAGGVSDIPLVPGVVLLAYSALVDAPVKAAITATIIGLLIDAMSGTPLGLNVLACVLALVVSRFFVAFVSRPRGLPGFLFTGGLSAGYHFIALTLLFAFGAGRESFGFRPLLVTALANALASLVLFPLAQVVLVALGLEERDPSLNERLASKG